MINSSKPIRMNFITKRLIKCITQTLSQRGGEKKMCGIAVYFVICLCPSTKTCVCLMLHFCLASFDFILGPIFTWHFAISSSLPLFPTAETNVFLTIFINNVITCIFLADYKIGFYHHHGLLAYSDFLFCKVCAISSFLNVNFEFAFKEVLCRRCRNLVPGKTL